MNDEIISLILLMSDITPLQRWQNFGNLCEKLISDLKNDNQLNCAINVWMKSSFYLERNARAHQGHCGTPEEGCTPHSDSSLL